MTLNAKRFAFFLIILGIIFGMETYFGYNFLYYLWPLLLTSLGAGFVGIFFKREKRESTFLGIGTYVICLSILFLYCNFSSWYELKYLWPLFISFIGISFLLLYIFFSRHKLYLFLFITFISISIVFLLVFSISYKFWWLIFIFLGIAIFLSEVKK